MHSPLGVKLPIREIPGFETVSDLIPEGNLMRFTAVWALRLERYIGPGFELHRRLVLDLAESFELDSRPLIRLSLLEPRQCSIPDDEQILGLAVEDLRSCGMEGIRFCVYDYEEMSGLDVLCAALELSRASKPDYP
ncbi:MAG TPA: hypothetical protein VG796_21525 [Verrucomicrobiales bacterium]|nr:hypothetical protein [Verrucomicrobiales bacterium]